MANVPKDTNDAEAPLLRARLRTPRAAAIAGILFSGLLITSLWLLRMSVPADPLEAGAWLATDSRRVMLALNLVPFAGVAFLWFVGVLRDRLGTQEDRFFATVFLGSGFLFLGMLFVAAAAAGGLILAHTAQPHAILDAGTFAFARAFVFGVMRVYAYKMAAVFMITTSTLAIRTRITPRWVAVVGYACALFLLFGSGQFDWALMVFPAWVLLVSSYILAENLHGAPHSAPQDAGR